MSVRIHQLANEIGFKNEGLLYLLKSRGFEVKSVSSTVDNITVDKIREEFKHRIQSPKTEAHEEPQSRSFSTDADEVEIPKSLPSLKTINSARKMKIVLNLKALEAQPRKFVSFLHDEDQGPTDFSGRARQKELHMLQQFVGECLLKPLICLIYRRWAYHTKQESQFVLRLHPNMLSEEFNLPRSCRQVEM